MCYGTQACGPFSTAILFQTTCRLAVVDHPTRIRCVLKCDSLTGCQVILAKCVGGHLTVPKHQAHFLWPKYSI